jgi:hypothetical protein
MLQVAFIENQQLVVQEAQDRMEEKDIKGNLLRIGRSWTIVWLILTIGLNSYLPLALISSVVLIA